MNYSMIHILDISVLGRDHQVCYKRVSPFKTFKVVL